MLLDCFFSSRVYFSACYLSSSRPQSGNGKLARWALFSHSYPEKISGVLFTAEALLLLEMHNPGLVG